MANVRKRRLRNGLSDERDCEGKGEIAVNICAQNTHTHTQYEERERVLVPSGGKWERNFVALIL